ncbi:DUF732 domain-containing protein [Pseudofrankia inefficax]|uniref:DUF732 domain-containing protein n=1 Tax=Pseudofrankia inefficax (strain DSM 45817 / CECT 9037 / DDB 130130 / EuI1c) TaxID=298654 RepID=E3J5B9_PSEI1|nr:DUF732 domain-containing protein [Pseudofrankia inefficax]ADP80717.1 protein of unknown function DUF732 [Pseudofrankia inefficax]
MRPWRLAARAAVGMLAGVLALVVAGCGPNIENDLPPATASPTGTPSPGPVTPSASPSLPPGDRAYLAQLAATLPGLSADDDWKIEQASWTCLELDAGMTLRGAATTSALVSDDRLTVASATTLARAAVPNYCPRHTGELAFDGDAPLDRTLDANGQGACFWLDYAQELSSGGKRVGDIDLAYAVFAAGASAKKALPPDFRDAWLAMTSDISTPQGIADREALCGQHGWPSGLAGTVGGGGGSGGSGGGGTGSTGGVGQPA